MKIDTRTGSIAFPPGEIDRSLGKARFLESDIGRTARESLVTANWSHYEIDPEEGWLVTVIFDGDVIDRIFLSMKLTADDPESWTVEREHDRRAAHDAWLRGALGRPPYAYAWGRVVSDFDPKGLASEIIVAYDR
jgi:hypothetical protein